jgi:hypothetical protein
VNPFLALAKRFRFLIRRDRFGLNLESISQVGFIAQVEFSHLYSSKRADLRFVRLFQVWPLNVNRSVWGSAGSTLRLPPVPQLVLALSAPEIPPSESIRGFDSRPRLFFYARAHLAIRG